MNVSFEWLRIFKTVAFYGNISKAAKSLCVTQPSITKSIKKLEEELNVQLFVRDKKGVVLTDVGKTIYRYILDSINTLDNVELLAKDISIADVGKLRIGAGLSVTKNILKDTIVEYKKMYPNISIEIYNLSTEQLYNELRYGRLDLIFINSTLVINTNKYKNFKLLDIEECFFTTPEIYNKIKNAINIKSILSQSLIVQNENYDTRTFLNNICLKNNIQLKPIIEVDRHELIVEFVKEGLGIGFATKEYIKSYLDSKELIEIKIDFNIEKRHINAVYRNENNTKLNNFIKILKNNIKQ